MRLLVASWARGAVGGVETYLRGVVPGLIARGHAVALLFEHRYEAASAPAPHDPYAACAAEWCAETTGAAAALTAARAWRPDLVWLHGLEDPRIEAGLLQLAPAMLYAHNYDGACATGEKFHRWPRPRPCARIMGPGCAAVNFTHRCGTLNPARFAAGWNRQRQRQRALDRYRRVLVASRHMEAELARHGADPGRIRRVGYPRTEPLGSAPAPRPDPPSQLLMMARLTVAKGGAALLHAAAAVEATLGRRLRLTLAGEGPERPRLQALARKLNLDADFPGWIAPDARRRHLAASDLLVVPSLWPEPFGLVGLEAAAHGVPAVAYAVGGIPDWLEPGYNGELAPADPPTVAGLSAALLRVLGDAAHWQRLRQGAWQRAGAFALDPHLDRIEAAMAEAVAGPA